MKTTDAVEESIVGLFADWPVLYGFTVRLEGGLALSDVGFFPQPGAEGTRVICEEIRDALLELVDERPEARQLLAGRTFARALH